MINIKNKTEKSSLSCYEACVISCNFSDYCILQSHEKQNWKVFSILSLKYFLFVLSVSCYIFLQCHIRTFILYLNFLFCRLCFFYFITTCQSLRGPRGGMIFYKKDLVLGVDLESAISNAVFPGLQVCDVSNLFYFPKRKDNVMYLIWTLLFLLLNCSQINWYNFYVYFLIHNVYASYSYWNITSEVSVGWPS